MRRVQPARLAIGLILSPSKDEAVLTALAEAHASTPLSHPLTAPPHTIPSVISAALALAEQRNKTGEQFLRSVITGYELAGRIPKGLGVTNLRQAGIANHGVVPVFAAAAASGSIMGLPQDKMAHLFTYCAQQASGSWQWLMDVEHIEKAFVFAGMGARNGLQAAIMVELGFTGVRDSLDHKDGWARAPIFTKPDGDGDRAYMVSELNVRSELPATADKRYPSGGPAQPGVEGVLKLLPQIDRANVKSVLFEMPGRWQAFRDAAMPALNLRYLASIIILDGKLDFTAAQSLDRMANDAQVKALMQRVDVKHDPAQEAAPGAERTESARVIVEQMNGKRHEIYIPYVVGFPSHPMSKQDVETKSLELMTPRLGAQRARDVVAACWSLDRLPAASSLISLIAS